MAKETKEIILEMLSEASAESINFLSPSTGEEGGNSETSSKHYGVVVGKLMEFNNQRQPLVNFPGNSSTVPIVSRSIIQLNRPDSGKEVLLMFEHSDPRKPIIMGILQHSEETPPATQPEQKTASSQELKIELDGERVTLTAKKEIVLQCGKASITLTKTGKILIRGAYVSSRSSGPNLIKGGSVQLN